MALSPEVIETLNNLSADEAREAMKLLGSKLAAESDQFFVAGATYEVWTPFDSGNAVSVLKKMLEDDEDA
jgi:hypothetical protein